MSKRNRSRPHGRGAAARREKRRQTSATAATSSRQDALAIVALGVLVVVCYLPAMLWGDFVWDDVPYIVEAEFVRICRVWGRSGFRRMNMLRSITGR